MNAVKQTCALALALGALAMGCGSDDGGNNDDKLDASQSVLDASLDSGSADAGPRVSTATCNSLVRPANGNCGGSHCKETEAALRLDTPTTAKCGADLAVASFCSLDTVDKVGTCARAALGAEGQTRTCALAALPALAPDCVECFVQSAACAGKFENCFAECAGGDSIACDQCRIDKGCIESFYRCAGFKPPTW